MTRYVALVEPWHRVPLLKPESIANYFEQNVKPHIGTSYGDVEKRHWQELKKAAELGCELVAVPEIREITV